MSNKRLLLAVLFALACAHPQPPVVVPPPAAEATASAASIRRYTVLMAGNKAGSQVVTARDGEVTVDFEYNDRGRGPKTHSVIRLRNAMPVSLETTGNDYLKQQIEERFAVENGIARWTNTAEKGEQQEGALYASMYGPPEEIGVLAGALLRHGGKLALAGGGEAAIRKVGERTLHDGKRVVAYEITGFGFTPFEFWLDEQQNYFATASSWFTTIREGYESDIPQLIADQDARKLERGRVVTQKLTQTPIANRLIVTGARVFDPRTGTVSEPKVIVVEGNRIVSVDHVGTERSAATLIKADGKVVMPGLWDMHVHLDETDALLHVAAGITSARDLGNDSDDVLALKRKIQSGETIGPRLVLAGLVDGPGPFKGPTKILADNEDEARNAVDYFAGRGYEGLKIYSSVKPELVPVMTKYAHEKGLRVSGHIPANMRAEDAVDAGYDEIQHANMLLLNFMPDVKDTRTPLRFTAVAERAADLDLASNEVRAFIEKLRAKKIVVDPTVTVFEGMFTARTGSLSPSYAMISDRLPPQVRRGFLTGGLPVPEGKDERYRASFRRMLELIGALHKAGVTIVGGTDGLAGFTLHRELELYAQAGISPADVLRIATLVPAQVMKREKDLGTIEAGKLADFILVDGDPTKNISDIRKVTTVVKDGKVYDSKAIYAELGIR